MKRIRLNKSKNRKLINRINQINGWLDEKEALKLYEIARSLPPEAVIVEIGSYEGKSTVWLGKALRKNRTGKLYSVDHHIGSPEKGESEATVNTWEKFRQNINKFGLEETVTAIKKDSSWAVIDFDKRIDLLFIDGNHEFEEVDRDWRLWTKKLSENAWVVLHDATVLPGPWLVAKREVLLSSSFRRVGMKGSIIFGRLERKQGSFKKLFTRVINYLKYLYIISYVRMRKINWARNLKILTLNFFHDLKKR